MKVRIQITQQDIDSGQRDHCTACPAARAMNRDTKRPWHVSGSAAAPLDEQGYWNPALPMVVLPGVAREWISRFDRGETVAPLEFEIDLDGGDSDRPGKE